MIDHLRSLLSIIYQTSYQHAKISDAVLKRDEQDMKSIEEFIDERDIFGGDLRNIANGMIANDYVNVGDFDKKSEKNIQIPCLSEIKIGNETTNIDPMLLLQRLVFISIQSAENVEDIISYELSTFPTCLFDDSCMMREAKKEKLWKKLDNHDFVENIAYCSYVLDGGALLHKIVCQKVRIIMRLSSKLSDM